MNEKRTNSTNFVNTRNKAKTIVNKPRYEYVFSETMDEPTISKGKKTKKTVGYKSGTIKVRKIDTQTMKSVMMTIDDVKKLEDSMKTKFGFGGANDKYYMRVYGISVSQCYTIKSFQDTELDTEWLSDYMNGKVKDPRKFEEIFQLTVKYMKDAGQEQETKQDEEEEEIIIPPPKKKTSKKTNK